MYACVYVCVRVCMHLYIYTTMYQIQATVAVWNSSRWGWTWSQLQQQAVLYRSIYRSSQDLHTRTFYEHPRRTFRQTPTQGIFNILMQGPDLLRRISAGSPQDLLTRTWTRSCKDTERMSPGPLQERLSRTCTRSCKGPDSISLGSPQELLTRTCKRPRQDLHARALKRSSQDRHTRTCCCWSGSCKILIQEPPRASHKSFHTSTSKT